MYNESILVYTSAFAGDWLSWRAIALIPAYRFEVSVARSSAANLASMSSNSIALLAKLMMDSEHRARVEGGTAKPASLVCHRRQPQQANSQEHHEQQQEHGSGLEEDLMQSRLHRSFCPVDSMRK